MMTCQDRQSICPYFVGKIEIFRDSIGPGDNEINLLAGHQMTRHIIRNNLIWDSCFRQLPGGKPGALQDGAGFIDPDFYSLAGEEGCVDNTECRADPARSQHTGIAVRKYAAWIRDDFIAEISHSIAHMFIFPVNTAGLLDQDFQQVIMADTFFLL